MTSIAEEPQRSALGKKIMFQHAVRFCTQRLLLEELLHVHPEINDIEIKSPLIILGLPRSGSTHLVNLIARDSKFRSLSRWECEEPLPNHHELAVTGTDNRRQRCIQQLEYRRSLLPHLAAMKPYDADDTAEEFWLQGLDFGGYVLDCMSLLRPWKSQGKDRDQTQHYEFMKTVLKALQWQRGPERWILKTPDHAGQIRALTTVFPDATVVVTHRDPMASLQSVATLSAYRARLEYTSFDLKDTVHYWAAVLQNWLDSVMCHGDLIDKQRRVDVTFEELTANHRSVVERIYSVADINMTSAAEWQLESFARRHGRGVRGRMIYNLAEDFDVDIRVIADRFASYLRSFPIAREMS
ncbi:sulfotransferase [Amycolatopsis sp. K13G38]|uniref:Sulfotransferase n=1 Tax=Amycolatopsis acididurans TaxID=2724524 RepID=A0ABX1J6U3_9PSEU|nr:sulfotransferase [Amycolatopsis acididurans]